jgi:hypothetical protein
MQPKTKVTQTNYVCMQIHLTEECMYIIQEGVINFIVYCTFTLQARPISTQVNFPQKENFVKCDWLTQIFCQKKILKLTLEFRQWYFVCDVTLSVYPHRASLKNMPGHGGNTSPMLCQLNYAVRSVRVCDTVVRHIFQACPVWIYTQKNITNIIFTWVNNTNT